jgi:hypothetical protein
MADGGAGPAAQLGGGGSNGGTTPSAAATPLLGSSYNFAPP